MQGESCVPNPEYLIKSIAEQGYSLETSIADLIDNSISAGAGKIEVLIDTMQSPFKLFIADDGRGMSLEELKKNMRFPSSSVEVTREPDDLGRFGLGLKTASFAQTRYFTVISRKRGESEWNARTWDVNHLKTGRWEIIVNTAEEIGDLIGHYKHLSSTFYGGFRDYTPNTVIFWNGLYKFDNIAEYDNKSEILQKELTEITREYLQMIFHRFLGKAENPLLIRLNNQQLRPFNPFPGSVRNISVRQKLLMGNNLRLEGFVLPNRSLEESKGTSEWTLSHKSLMDMEGIYIYRADRLIVFGGWAGVIKSAPRLQLARLKVEIGNGIDHLFHLNVAKSSIIIPFGERIAFMRYVSELKQEAEKEYYNYETRVESTKSFRQNIFRRIPTSSGMRLEIDFDFPLLKDLAATLSPEQRQSLKLIFRLINTTINKIRKVHSEETFTHLAEKDDLSESGLTTAVKLLLANGMNKKNILDDIIPSMGINRNSLPPSILVLLK